MCIGSLCVETDFGVWSLLWRCVTLRVTSVTLWLMCNVVIAVTYIFIVDCVSILIRAFELTALCCGQPGASNFVMQRLCLQVQVAAPREVHSDG